MSDMCPVIGMFDYGFWKMRVEDFLHDRDLKLALEGKLKEMDEVEYRKIDRKMMTVVCVSLSRSVVSHMAHAESKIEILQILSKMYEQPLAMNKSVPYAKFVQSQDGRGTAVDSDLNAFNVITSQLA